jgi:hypothetical protein
MRLPVLTDDDRARIQALLLEAQGYLREVDSIEHVIANMLDLTGDQADEVITDAIGARWTLDQLLQNIEDISA